MEREKSLLCDPGSESRLGGREKRRAKIINGMKKRKEKWWGCPEHFAAKLPHWLMASLVHAYSFSLTGWVIGVGTRGSCFVVTINTVRNK